MTSGEAKETLLLYRPGLDEQDPDFTSALAQMRGDPELTKWFDQHCALQKAVFSSFERLPVPAGFKEQILSERPEQPPPVTAILRRKTAMLVFAVIPVLLLLTFMAFYSHSPSRIDLASYRLGMRGKILRYPRMDLETADLDRIRQYLAEHGGHKDYVLPPALEKVAGTGCAILEWRGKKVSMVCFNSGRNGKPTVPDLFLFIVDS